MRRNLNYVTDELVYAHAGFGGRAVDYMAGWDLQRAVHGRRVQDVPLPDGSLIISVLRDGSGFVPKADSVIQGGDQVLLILDPGLEGQITPQFAPIGSNAAA